MFHLFKPLRLRNCKAQLYTTISRKVAGQRPRTTNVHATIPKGSMGYDQYTVSDTVAVEPNFLLSFSTRKHTSMAFQATPSNFFENSELKTTHNSFRGRPVLFFQQSFSK